MKIHIAFVKCTVLVVTAALSLSCLALDSRDGGSSTGDGCSWIDGSDFECSETTPIPPGAADPWSCAKNPQRCLPTRPPIVDGGTDIYPGYGSVEVRESNAFTQASLAALDCGELNELQKLQEMYAEAEKHIIESEVAGVNSIDIILDSANFSDRELDHLRDVEVTSCDTYELMRNNRLDKEKCVTTAGKEICHTPTATAQEKRQELACIWSRRDLKAREASLLSWKQRKAIKQENIKSLTASMRSINSKLGKIAAEMKKKQCH